MTTSKNVTRPTSLAEWLERRQQPLPLREETRQHGLSYRPQPTDVFISPYAKCGTTWLQQIVHGLRTRGDMDFDDISRVVPWLENSLMVGLDLYAPQRGAFQAFKSHLTWHDIPKGGRYIVSFRDPKDALISNYYFLDGWHWEAGAISIEEFAKGAYLARRDDVRGGYWYHLTSWWEQRHNPQVLLLSYEAMKADLPGTVRAIANFLEIDPEHALLELVVSQSSLDFMLAHKDKFDDLLMRELHIQHGHLPPGGDSAKVRTGRVGDHRAELPADISAEMDAIWSNDIEARFGLPSYQALSEALG
jgi:hypothetical protein